jgi:glutamate/tyrosine decarboxylase-like PLP-dependent enzyme
LLAGLEDVDSLALDPHKWLFQPFEIGCVLVRESQWLEETFRLLPEYLTDAQTHSGEVNFCDRGVQLTRGFRALKLWLSLQIFGRAAFAEAIARGMRLAEFAETTLRALPHWDVITPAQLAILTFRYAPPHLSEEECETLQRKLVEDLTEDGFAMISTTSLRGQTVMRMCPINPRTTEHDLVMTIHRLQELARRYETNLSRPNL